MTFDGKGNYTDEREYRADEVRRDIRNDDLVPEVTLLRNFVKDLKECLKHVRPFVTSPTAQKRINKALANKGGLPYEIH